MFHKISFLLVCLTSACAGPHFEVYVGGEAPGWVSQVTFDAVTWWSGHGADIVVGDTGTLVDVGTFPTSTQMGGFQWVTDRIILAEKMERYAYSGEPYATRYPVCVMAHELGHMMGMAHVADDDSLMSPIVHLHNNDCLWSEYDRAEYP